MSQAGQIKPLANHWAEPNIFLLLNIFCLNSLQLQNKYTTLDPVFDSP